MNLQMRHSTLQVIALNITLMFFIGFSYAEDEEQYYKDREKAENATGKFDPAYFKKNSFNHIIVFIKVVEGKLHLSEKPAQIRPGKMPHHAKSSNAPYRVSYYADGKEIGSYAGRDPFVVDSYDPDHGPKEGVITNLQNGLVEILLPYMPIQRIKIFRARKETAEFDVTEKIKRAKHADVKR
jgi:hypothetical protein